MTLKVIHFYTMQGLNNYKKEIFNGNTRFVAKSDSFLTNSITVWEINNGKLFTCEIYSDFGNGYIKSYIPNLFEYNAKSFLEWLDIDIYIPSKLLFFTCEGDDSYRVITIRNGYVKSLIEKSFR